MEESELAAIKKSARRQKMTTAEWVRQALRAARRAEPAGDVTRKLAAIRRAAQYSFPTGDIDQMLAEIESGYLSGPGPRR